jgi:citrate synthase
MDVIDQPRETPRGLEGIVVAQTVLSDVRGQEGFYHYRQYDATELSTHRPLEDIWYLFFRGELPTTLAQRAAFSQEIAARRAIPTDLIPILREFVTGESFDLLASLRTAVSLLAAKSNFRPSIDISREELYENALRISAVTPTLITTLYRLRKGLEPIPPDPKLSASANYLYMLHGTPPDERLTWALERYLALTIDHGFNSSTFTARVIASTAADIGAAIVGAIGALSGPLHGGAPSRALDMLDEIGTPERAEPWIREAILKGERIMGFGHRIYKAEDPRSRVLRQVAVELGGPTAIFARQIEQTVVRLLTDLKPGRNLYTNVEFYAGVVMDSCNIPREMFTPTFVSSRVIGWCAHVLEQVDNNRLIRPSAQYVGPPPPQPVPLLQ